MVPVRVLVYEVNGSISVVFDMYHDDTSRNTSTILLLSAHFLLFSVTRSCMTSEFKLYLFFRLEDADLSTILASEQVDYCNVSAVTSCVIQVVSNVMA